MSERDVFINCPFSADYRNHFRAIVFAVVRSGFAARCAMENDDGGENRYAKICRIIRDCPYGVHDISKTEGDPGSGLPRFNMPFELGLFLGAKTFAGRAGRAKKALILDREPFRYQAFLSDIAGQDIHAHNGDVGLLIERVATWLRDEVQDPNVPGGRAIAAEFARFSSDVPAVCAAKRLDPDEITFKDFRAIAAAWIEADSARS
ncbi:MAG TPA: hypothetical protein VHZ26_16590 [Caulobacteraceae bacterium]|jgi:hypothetical protein|nr:hypothetical protein [Caulobacteraceae bacterium]